MRRFSIRDVLWLTSLVAVALAWATTRGQCNRYKEETDEAMNALMRLAAKWSAEKGEVIYFNCGKAEYGANPEGTITVYRSKR
jgi:hypothetical protein